MKKDNQTAVGKIRLVHTIGATGEVIETEHKNLITDIGRNHFAALMANLTGDSSIGIDNPAIAIAVGEDATLPDEGDRHRDI